MDLFGFIGVSNTAILTTAASVAIVATLISLAIRAIKGTISSSELNQRVDRLEMRLADRADYQSVLQMADTVLNEVSPLAATPVTEMFEASETKRSWFGPKVEPSEVAQNVINDLKDNLEIAAAIARPIQNMHENGAIEVAAERSKAVAETKRLAAGLNTAAWDRHAKSMLTQTVPSYATSLLLENFAHIHALKKSATTLSKKSGIDDLMETLRHSANLLKSAEQSVEAFKQHAA